jgi:hypothetical protein
MVPVQVVPERGTFRSILVMEAVRSGATPAAGRTEELRDVD